MHSRLPPCRARVLITPYQSVSPSSLIRLSITLPSNDHENSRYSVKLNLSPRRADEFFLESFLHSRRDDVFFTTKFLSYFKFVSESLELPRRSRKLIFRVFLTAVLFVQFFYNK